MAIKMVRQPSDTPNINNVDDFIPFRYAYGDQNGYVKDKGTELSYNINGNKFVLNSGRVVLQGIESDIDANGVTLTIDSVSETRYYVVYYEINLATNTANIKLSNYSTTGYPTIDAGDDLTANSSGTARLSLYRFTAKSGVISDVKKIVSEIKYSFDYIDENVETINNNFNNSQATKFGEYIIEKKKLLWEGLWTEGSNALTFSGLKVGDIVELEYSVIPTNVASASDRIERFVLNQSSNDCYIITPNYQLTGSNIVTPQIISSSLIIEVPSSIDLNSSINTNGSTYNSFIQSTSSSGSNPLIQVDYSTYRLKIKKIYKVIR